MAYTPSILEDQIFTAVRAFLLLVVGGEVVQGNDNRVAMPKGSFVVMSRTNIERLATNITTYTDQPTGTPTAVELKTETQKIKMSLQLDIYGPSAGDQAVSVSTAWRSDIGCEFLAPYGVQPLYSDDPKYIPLTNDENQYENRYMVEAFLQYDPSISVAQQFFDTVGPDSISVDPVDIFVTED